MNQPKGTMTAENPRATPQEFWGPSLSHLGKTSSFFYPEGRRGGTVSSPAGE